MTPRLRGNAGARDRRVCTRLTTWGTSHPLIAVLVVSLMVRLTTAATSYLVNRPLLVPDEGIYVDLARHVGAGSSAESWYPGWGQALYDQTWAFCAPLALVSRLLWPTRAWGQGFAAIAGAGTAVAAAWLALRLRSARIALVAGLLVALVPSQVLFSSVVLRESQIWLALAVTGIGTWLLARDEVRMVIVGAATSAGGLLWLSLLREQTLVVAAWSLALAALVIGRRNLARRATLGVVVAALVPWLTGSGILGLGLVRQEASTVGSLRAGLSQEARSGYADFRAAPGLKLSGQTGDRVALGGGESALVGGDGMAYVSEEGLWANLVRLPRGLAGVLVRPFVWDANGDGFRTLAKLENLLWLGTYALALLGVAASVGNTDRRTVVAFPVVVAMGIVLQSALTQGNVGTAFRHRGQILWAIAVLAAIGLEALVRRARGEDWHAAWSGELGGSASPLV